MRDKGLSRLVLYCQYQLQPIASHCPSCERAQRATKEALNSGLEHWQMLDTLPKFRANQEPLLLRWIPLNRATAAAFRPAVFDSSRQPYAGGHLNASTVARCCRHELGRNSDPVFRMQATTLDEPPIT